MTPALSRGSRGGERMNLSERGRRARELRHSMTEPEVILWSRLKLLRSRGFHVRRQAPFRGYYLDFVCFDRRVVIEVDGVHHKEGDQAAHDALRDAILARASFQVLRFENSVSRQNLDGVMYSILTALEAAEISPPVSRPGREPPSP